MHLTKKTGRPLMSGYLGHTLNAGTLQNNFTNVRYVVLFRDPINTALSLLKVRRKSEAEWISIFPKECESVLERSIFEQVMAQVYWANRRLLKCARAKNSIVMHFEELWRVMLACSPGRVSTSSILAARGSDPGWFCSRTEHLAGRTSPEPYPWLPPWNYSIRHPLSTMTSTTAVT